MTIESFSCLLLLVINIVYAIRIYQLKNELKKTKEMLRDEETRCFNMFVNR